MGLIGETLASQFKKIGKMKALQEQIQSCRGIGIDPHGVKTTQELIDQGLDPLHAAYISVQHLTSTFSEQVSALPEFRAYHDIIAFAEEEYMPSGPPMSPLTRSYFTCWAFFDVRFGPDQETIGTCLLDAASALNLSPDVETILESMQNSRLGVYEHLGIHTGRVLLEDIVTKDRFTCYVPAGYWGEKGQCWIVRLLPPLQGLFDYCLVFNTPYVWQGSSTDDWAAFFKRTLLGTNEENATYSHLMKYGTDVHYWSEYVFQAYHHHQEDAIFLEGVPDILDSLPHGSAHKPLPIQSIKRNRNRPLKVKKNRRRR